MSKMKLFKSEMKDEKGQAIRLAYDQDQDILEIFFGDNEPATGIGITDHILLRIVRETGRAVSLTLMHLSILLERTEYGPRSYPLDKIEELPEDIRDQVIHAITTSPVNKFLKLSFFQESPERKVPLTYIEPQSFASVA